MVINKKILKFLGLFLFSSIIVILNLWIIGLFFSNSGNVFLVENYQLYNIVVTVYMLLMVFFVPFVFNGFGNIFLPWMNNCVLLFLAQKIKLSFFSLFIFFMVTLFLSGNFCYTSGNNDLPLPNSGNPIEGLIVFLVFTIFCFISVKHNSDVESLNSSSSSSTSSLDIKEIDEINKIITNPILINEIKNIPKVNLLDEMLINKFIAYGVLIFGFGVMWFVIYKVLYLYNNPNDIKPKNYLKKLKKK